MAQNGRKSNGAANLYSLYRLVMIREAGNVETIPNPRADAKILLGDELICFGKLENIRNQLA